MIQTFAKINNIFNLYINNQFNLPRKDIFKKLIVKTIFITKKRTKIVRFEKVPIRKTI